MPISFLKFFIIIYVLLFFSVILEIYFSLLFLNLGAEGIEIEPPAGSMTPATFRLTSKCSLRLHMGAEGIEPPPTALEAARLPLSYAPFNSKNKIKMHLKTFINYPAFYQLCQKRGLVIVISVKTGR